MVDDGNTRRQEMPINQRFSAGDARRRLAPKVEKASLHDWYVGIRNGRVEALWPVSARGASR
jgi:hypothetical protein